MGWRGYVLTLAGLAVAVVALPSTVILLVGLLPTMVAVLIDRSKKRTKSLTVGAMNVAGCVPFLIDLWTTANTLENALSVISDPRTIVVIYSAAAIGYLIDWALSGIVATLMVQRAESRRAEIKKRHADLIERWGREVTGEIPLDPYGFPIEGYDPDLNVSDKDE